MDDRFNLERFKRAQDTGAYARALAEIKNGRKVTHWIWFVFPQFDGLGYSAFTKNYSIKSADEAREYLNDGLLNYRLREICQALLDLPENDPKAILGDPDWVKVFSSMTLFDYVSPNDIFAQVLDKYYKGQRDTYSIALIGGNN